MGIQPIGEDVITHTVSPEVLTGQIILKRKGAKEMMPSDKNIADNGCSEQCQLFLTLFHSNIFDTVVAVIWYRAVICRQSIYGLPRQSHASTNFFSPIKNTYDLIF